MSGGGFETAAGIAMVVAGGLVVWHQYRRAPGLPPPTPPPSPIAVPSQILVGSTVTRPAAQIAILTAQQLLHRTGCQGLAEEIYSVMSLSAANSRADVVPLIERFAEFVQLLPASESHHHAQPGGLLEHTLEVAVAALRQCQGMKLPRGAAPEDQIRLAPAWSMGVLVGAMLHDIGKPVADVVVKLFGHDPSTPLVTWNGLAGSMIELGTAIGATHYTVEFPVERDYGAHSRLGVALIRAMVPPGAMQWLARDEKLLMELMSYISGDPKDTVLRELIQHGDQVSVATNLAKGNRTRLASAKSVPLIERLMLALRALLADGALAINRPGAALFVDPDGAHAWMVAGVVADQVRNRVKLTAAKHDPGVPTDNTRLFDTWFEYGASVPPPKEYGKGSVWWVRIEIGDWNQVLTVLKFRMDDLYPRGGIRPRFLDGVVVPVSPNNSTAGPVRDVATTASDVVDQGAGSSDDLPLAAAQSWGQIGGASADVPAGAFEESPQTVTSDGAFAQELMALVMGTSITDSIESGVTDPVGGDNRVVHAHAPPATEDVFLSEHESAGAVTQFARAAPTRAVQALKPVSAQPKAVFMKSGAKPRPNADRFVAWLQQGLGTGEVNYNDVDSFVHFVAEGMLIVSPIAFREYLSRHAFEGDIGTSKDALRALQGEMQKAGYIAFDPSQKSFFHKFAAKREGGLGASLTCYLIPNPQAYVRPVPSPNELLVRVKKPTSETA